MMMMNSKSCLNLSDPILMTLMSHQNQIHTQNLSLHHTDVLQPQLLDLPGRLDGEHLQLIVSQSSEAYQKGATMMKLQLGLAVASRDSNCYSIRLVVQSPT